jgi:hypothetical protein
VWLEHRQSRQPASSGLLLAGLRAPPIRRLDINGPPAGVHSRWQFARRLLLLLPPEAACSQTKSCLMCLANQVPCQHTSSTTFSDVSPTMGGCQCGLEALRNSPAKLPLHMMHKPVNYAEPATTGQDAV